MKIYPFKLPIILTDSIFTQYGGITGSSTSATRKAAYFIAEQQLSTYLGTLLLPTVITGTYDFFGNPKGFIPTDYGYVSKLLWLRVLDTQEKELYVLSGTNSFGAIHEDTFGYIYVENVGRLCGCLNSQGYYPGTKQEFKFQYAYEAGLPTGVGDQPSALILLTAAAQLVLNELEPVPANESTGDVGVEEFISLGYREYRKKWKNTAFGASAKSAWISHLADSTFHKARRSVMLGRI